MNKLSYDQKLKTANKYLFETCGLTWDDLPDVNSLHDCETKADVYEACDSRLSESGFPPELLNEEE